MARLSNFLSPGNARDGGGPIVCRVADRSRGEIEAGLRLILAGRWGLADDGTVLDFLSVAIHRRIDVNLLWVAERAGRIMWAVLPVPNPGRTMLLLTPGRLHRQTPPQAVRLLSDAVCREYARHDVVLAQVLLDPSDRTVSSLYHGSGFTPLAELLYLQKDLAHSPPPIELEPGWEMRSYEPATHALFAEAIERSYAGSLDCPALNGVRQIDDIIAGHRASGMFDPSLWFALTEGGTVRGTILLNPTFDGDGVELVYLGVVPESRGRGIGDRLMRLGIQHAETRGFRRLSLAVDARNAPALRLYYRHGLQRVGRRVALLRDLRRGDLMPASL